MPQACIVQFVCERKDDFCQRPDGNKNDASDWCYGIGERMNAQPGGNLGVKTIQSWEGGIPEGVAVGAMMHTVRRSRLADEEALALSNTTKQTSPLIVVQWKRYSLRENEMFYVLGRLKTKGNLFLTPVSHTGPQLQLSNIIILFT